MALIKVENAKVLKAVGTRGGFSIEEWVTLPDGRTFPKSYTVWYEGNSNTYKEGQIVTVTGELSAKVFDYVNETTGQPGRGVSININNPEITLQHDVAETTTEELPF